MSPRRIAKDCPPLSVEVLAAGCGRRQMAGHDRRKRPARWTSGASRPRLDAVMSIALLLSAPWLSGESTPGYGAPTKPKLSSAGIRGLSQRRVRCQCARASEDDPSARVPDSAPYCGRTALRVNTSIRRTKPSPRGCSARTSGYFAGDNTTSVMEANSVPSATLSKPVTSVAQKLSAQFIAM